VYGRHPDELSPEQRKHLRSFIALALIESEKLKAATQK